MGFLPTPRHGLWNARSHRQTARLVGIILMWAFATYLVHNHFRARGLAAPSDEELMPEVGFRLG